MTKALTFQLNLENEQFTGASAAAISQIDGIAGAARRANRSLIELQSGLLVKNNAQNLAASAAAQMRAGTYTLVESADAIGAAAARNVGPAMANTKAQVDLGRAMIGLGAITRQLGFVVAPEATMALTSVVSTTRLIKVEMAALGLGLAPVGLALVGVVAGLATFVEWIKKTKAEAEERRSAQALGEQLEVNKARLQGMLNEASKRGLVTPQERASIQELITGKPRTVEVSFKDFDLSKAYIPPSAPTVNAQATNSPEMRDMLKNSGRGMIEIFTDLKKASAILLEKGLGTGGLKTRDEFALFRKTLEAQSETDPRRKALLELDLERGKVMAEAFEKFGKSQSFLGPIQPVIDAWFNAQRGQIERRFGTSIPANTKIPVNELERMGFALRGAGGTNDYQRKLLDSNTRQEKILEKIAAKNGNSTPVNN